MRGQYRRCAGRLSTVTSRRLGTELGGVRRLLTAALGFVIALPGLTLTAGQAAAQDRVGVQPVEMILAVGPHDAAAPGGVGVRGPLLHQTVSATGVAAETGIAGAHDCPRRNRQRLLDCNSCRNSLVEPSASRPTSARSLLTTSVAPMMR